MSLADEKVEITPHLKLELRFLKSVSLADQKVETTPNPNLELGSFAVSVTC